MILRRSAAFLLWIIFFGVLSACTPATARSAITSTATSAASPTANTPTETAHPSPGPESTAARATPTPTDAPAAVLPRYDLKVILNFTRHSLAVDEIITYPNRTGQALTDFVLMVEPNRFPGGFRLNRLTAGPLAITNYTLTANRLQFTLPSPLPSGESITLSLGYDLSLPAGPRPTGSINASVYGYSSRQMNLVDWYPYVPPYHAASGWVQHNPWYYGEHQVYEPADFYVEIETQTPPSNLSLAAAAQAKMENGRYLYTHLKARNFTFSASDQYTVYARVVDGITVTSYVFPFDSRTGPVVLNDTAQALEVYNDLFGRYPHDSLSVVEVDFQDGMEFDGLYFLSQGFFNTYDGTPKGYLTMIGVHETAHQWWYGRVANDQALEPWLDEALATYSEWLFYSRVYPGFGDWWWEYRVNFFNPQGWVNQPIYEYSGSYPYRDGVYLRGARFLDELRKMIGDAEFFDFLKDYAARQQNQLSTSQAFFEILAQHTTRDLSALKAKYFKP